MKQTTSKATWRAVDSIFGPFTIGNIFLIAGIIIFGIFQPEGAPIPLWAGLTVALFMLVGVGFVIKGVIRTKNIRKSAKEDRRRLAAGLPLDPEDQTDNGR